MNDVNSENPGGESASTNQPNEPRVKIEVNKYLDVKELADRYNSNRKKDKYHSRVPILNQTD